MAGGGSGSVGRIALGAAGFVLGGLVGQPAIGATLGIALGSFLFPPKHETKIRQVRGVLGLSSVEGTPVAIIYGRVRIGGTVLWRGPLIHKQVIEESSSGGGKGGGSQETQSNVVEEWFECSFAIAIGEGPLNLHKIYKQKEVIDPNYTFYPGTSGQSPDPLVSSKTGKRIAYKHTAYVVFTNYNLGRNSALPQFTFEVSSQHDTTLKVEALEAGYPSCATMAGVKCEIPDEVVDESFNTHLIHGGFAVSPVDSDSGTPDCLHVTGSGGVDTICYGEAYVVNRETEDFVVFPPNDWGIIPLAWYQPGDMAITTVRPLAHPEFVRPREELDTQTEILDAIQTAQKVMTGYGSGMAIDMFSGGAWLGDANIVQIRDGMVFMLSHDVATHDKLEIWGFPFPAQGEAGNKALNAAEYVYWDTHYLRWGGYGGYGNEWRTTVDGAWFSILGLNTVNGKAYAAYRDDNDAGTYQLGVRTVRWEETDTGQMMWVAHWFWTTMDGNPCEVSFLADPNNANTFLYVIEAKDGRVFKMTVDTLDIEQISLNSIGDGHGWYGAVCGAYSYFGGLIYASYLERTQTFGCGRHLYEAPEYGNHGSVKYFDPSSGMWEPEPIGNYAQMGTGNWPRTGDSNVSGCAMHVDASGISFVKCYTDVTWTGQRTGTGMRGSRLCHTSDQFQTITEIDTYTHYNRFRYIEELDWIYRHMGVDESPDTSAEVANPPSQWSDHVYGRPTRSSTFAIVTTAEAMYDIMSNPRYGGGFSKGVDYMTAVNDCHTRDYYFNIAINERRDLSSILEVMAAHGWVMMIYSGDLIKLLVAKNSNAVKSLDINDFLGKQGENTIDVSESGRSERFNRLTVEWTDPAKEYSVRPLLVESLADQQDRGVVKNTVALNGFVVKNTVRNVGYLMLRSSMWGRRIMSFALGPEHINLEPGDIVTVDVPAVELDQVRCRILGVDHTTEFNETMSVREEPTYIYDTIGYSVPDSEALNPQPALGLSNVVGLRYLEVPKELLRTTNKLELAVLYGKPPMNEDLLGVSLYSSFDDGVTYDFVMTNTLPTSLGIIKPVEWPEEPWVDEATFSVDTSLTYGSSFDSVSREQMFNAVNGFIVDDEYTFIQTATVGSSNIYLMDTSVRGRRNTMNPTHLVGSTIYNISLVGTIPYPKEYIGTTFKMKAVPRSVFGYEAELADTPEITVTLQGWAFRPYKPDSIQLQESGIDRRSITTTADKDITVSWKLVDKESGYGRGGWGGLPWNVYAQDVDFIGSEIDVVVSGTVVRTIDAGSNQTATYTEAQNISDNGSFTSPIEFRAYSKSIYGRSRYYESVTITSVTI